SNHGAKLIPRGARILTHCNTGGLATAGRGTALGVISKAFEQDPSLHVYVDETRPLLQGGRLTTYELTKLRIPYTLNCDNMAGQLMALGKMDCVIVGSDRIARNGDFANKIGTYSLAVLCNYHKIPFFVAAPFSTVDLECQSGREIPIEQRVPTEVRGFQSLQWAPENAEVYNPAFDVTPAELVTAWILDTGVYSQDEIQNGKWAKDIQQRAKES
ncbi:MAG: S-methyl-5-thioribose-1-phosphate isomerase, partial [Bdellovibrionales bacterium]|nr:S-methyl-5-thioribose-1-phosphate isomerase [Bdellovibrionales bacterium]